MPHPIVTFLSDFGHADWFVGVVHGVLHSLAPEEHVVDLAHSVPPGDIARGTFLLEAAAGDFPPGTVHLAVVDPGVGTSRRALAVSARGQFFVGPDNGLLEWALCTKRPKVGETRLCSTRPYASSRSPSGESFPSWPWSTTWPTPPQSRQRCNHSGP